MILKTLSRHVKFRREKEEVLICECKRRIDLRLELEDYPILRKFMMGVQESDLDERESILYRDFEKLKMVSKLEFRQIEKADFDNSIDLINNVLGDQMFRERKFLREKFFVTPQFFIGAFLDGSLIGIITGFYREDYLLIGELVVDKRFRRRKIGRNLVLEFLKKADKKVHVGALNSAIHFYNSLNFNPFLLIQYSSEDYQKELFEKFNEKRFVQEGKNCMLETVAQEVSEKYIVNLKNKFPKASFQYIFVKEIPH